jgi:hypothetical protein
VGRAGRRPARAETQITGTIRLQHARTTAKGRVSMVLRSRLLVAGVLATLGIASLGAADPDPDFVRGRTAWGQRQYPEAARYLLSARAKPNGRNAETDYMIGTSGCRIAGREAWGKRYLSWALHSYSLDPVSRGKVERALKHCSAGSTDGAPDPVVVELLLAQTPPGARASGKVMDLGNQLVASRPATQIRRLTPSAIARAASRATSSNESRR